jgi:hypothetical protein
MDETTRIETGDLTGCGAGSADRRAAQELCHPVRILGTGELKVLP